MVAKKLPVLCAVSISLASPIGFAGMERFWANKEDQKTVAQMDECDALTVEQRHQLVKAYQATRDAEQKLDLKKRMEWFCKLSDQEQDRMRVAWQNMNTSERNKLKQKLQAATDLAERTEIRREFIERFEGQF
ncbi:restriction endonuclease [Acinetobacter sp.]|uniref:restriction endonuclease n=1 Tax=Acinetobacter sp. TaxID=472 RepID=UPI0035B0F963